jgi:hypothetical protein
MRMFLGTIDALAMAAETDADPIVALDEAVGWNKLLRVRDEVAQIAATADVDPLVRAADRHASLRKFAPALLQALEFKAARGSEKTIAAINVLRQMHSSGRRNVPPDAAMPFKKEWRALIVDGQGRIDRRLYETASLAHLRNKLRSGDVWVERSTAIASSTTTCCPRPTPGQLPLASVYPRLLRSGSKAAARSWTGD